MQAQKNLALKRRSLSRRRGIPANETRDRPVAFGLAGQKGLQMFRDDLIQKALVGMARLVGGGQACHLPEGMRPANVKKVLQRQIRVTPRTPSNPASKLRMRSTP